MSTIGDDVVERVTNEVLRRLQTADSAQPAAPPALATPTLSAGGRVPLQLHEPNTVHASHGPFAGRVTGQVPGPVVDLGVLDVCRPCSACGGCVTRRPKTVREMIANGAARISSTAGWLPTDSDIASLIDHTILKPDATRGDIEKLCAEAMEYCFATVCVNPTWVRFCAERLRGSRVRVCTVVGFPLGATLPDVKAYEATRAIREGAGEIDMVINIGELKSGNERAVEKDIRAVVDACGPRVLTKVIIETCLLSREEKITACRLSKAAGAGYVKTSTGFSTGGATVEDVRLMREVVGEDLGVKASGGIRDYDAAVLMVEAGATRLGTSASVKIVTSAKGARARAA
jgi:deoxyribose-phosphate aldolase